MDFRIDHVGYLTGDISKTKFLFEKLGYKQLGDVVPDDTQKTNICYLQKDGEVKIELVEPFEDNAPMLRMLKIRGVAPYHICYEVDDIYTAVDDFKKAGWVLLFAPLVSNASANKLYSYLFKKGIGYIEFVNKDPETGC